MPKDERNTYEASETHPTTVVRVAPIIQLQVEIRRSRHPHPSPSSAPTHSPPCYQFPPNLISILPDQLLVTTSPAAVLRPRSGGWAGGFAFPRANATTWAYFSSSEGGTQVIGSSGGVGKAWCLAGEYVSSGFGITAGQKLTVSNWPVWGTIWLTFAAFEAD
ncbi:hypothetical protein PM082_010176 [Marasmius tenuissimus]|nr:hypothetical protein PM082_010176 [Marasmius tenuissimus]